MKIISWNINGLRAVLKKGFLDFLDQEQPDIVCLQEIKIADDTRDKLKIEIPGYRSYWHGAKRPGYSGTAVLIRDGLPGFSVKNGFGLIEYDQEGRVQIIEANNFYLLNVYFPNANQELTRLDYKSAFNNELLKFILKLEKKKPVIITGDFNVAHEEIDLARPKENAGKAGFTNEERGWLDKLLSLDYLDSFRLFFPEKKQYSWWSFRAAARSRNVGWRIDYFVISSKLKNRIKKAYILDQVLGSDHAPVGIEL
jgi:exodeoxyribonuclease III